MAEWDPIGVKGIPGADHEYDSYMSAIYKMLVQRKSQREIFDYLWWMETERMGLAGDRQATAVLPDIWSNSFPINEGTDKSDAVCGAGIHEVSRSIQAYAVHKRAGIATSDAGPDGSQYWFISSARQTSIGLRV